MKKTNAMRMLDSANIKYNILEYEVDEKDLSGVSTAKKLNINPEQMFKTLVLTNDKKEIIVCCIPVAQELDLKKVAKHFHFKNVEMIAVKQLLNTCGYVRGSCSPIGMKKNFPTCFDETCILFDLIYISGGTKGITLEIKQESLIAFLHASLDDLCKG